MGIGVCGTKGMLTASDGLQLRRIRSSLQFWTRPLETDAKHVSTVEPRSVAHGNIPEVIYQNSP